MADLKSGRILEWHRLSPSLSLFRLVSLDGSPFPPYQAGQYIALRRDDCLLTRKVKEGNEVRYVPDLDAEGRQKRGPVTHSYSVSSAPFETAQGNHLEFYVVLERGRDGVLGRFTESLFRGVEDHTNERLAFLERIVGDFTLARRAAGFEHVLMVGTGTGLAPFVSMIKQLHFEAQHGAAPPAPAGRLRPGEQPASPRLWPAREGTRCFPARAPPRAAAGDAAGADRAVVHCRADLRQPERDGRHRLDRVAGPDAIREGRLVSPVL